MIISLHIPKTAGSSFRRALLEGVLGRVLLDYDDQVLSSYVRHRVGRFMRKSRTRLLAAAIERDYDLIHGHFHLGKYRGLFSNERPIMFLRDPVERVISHYRYWKNTEANYSGGNSLRDAFCRKQMSLVDFAETTEMRELYRRFMGQASMSQFYFVGLTERYAESLTILGALLGVNFAEYRIRAESKESLPVSLVERRALEEANRDNFEIYREACSRFNALAKSAVGLKI